MSEQTPESADEISLQPYVDAVWRYRRVIGLCVAGAALLFGLGTLALYLRTPTERIASLQFRLLFAGAEDNRYPSGQLFNPTEIVSPPVVAEVFQANELARYGTHQDLQQSVFLAHSNPALQQLDYSYQAKLSDTRLTPVDRTRIEEEFLRRREAIRNPEFTLSLRRNERFRTMPASMMEKVLTDTLGTWARQADLLKGAARPEVDVVSRDVFARAGEENASLLVRLDVMRSGARRILRSLSALQEVPGARAVRTTAERTLGDEQAAVEDIIKFDLEPLLSLARASSGAGQERPVLLSYVSNQIVTHRLNLRAATQRAQTLQISLREYMAQRGSRVPSAADLAPAAPGQTGPTQQQLVPQLGDSFIDRLMEMSAASQDEELEYRQSLTDKFIEASEQVAAADREVGYYEDLLQQLSAPSLAASAAANQELLMARFTATLNALNQSVDRVQTLYDEISVQTLNPARRLYTVTQPVRIQTSSSIVWLRILLLFVLAMCVTFLAAIAGSLVHSSYRSRTASHRPHPGNPAAV